MKWFKKQWPKRYTIRVYSGSCLLLGEAWCSISSKRQLKENIEVFFLETVRFYPGEDKDECFWICEEVK